MPAIDLWEVLRKPRITEKGTVLAEQSKYLFEVHPAANKHMVKQAVEARWPQVKVVAVNVMNMPGKRRRWKRHFSTQSDWKKAVVTLEAGQHIELLES